MVDQLSPRTLERLCHPVERIQVGHCLFANHAWRQEIRSNEMGYIRGYRAWLMIVESGHWVQVMLSSHCKYELLPLFRVSHYTADLSL